MIALDLAHDQRCRAGHEWRHVTAFFVEDQDDERALDKRDDQDVIACLRCNLVSIAPRHRGSDENRALEAVERRALEGRAP